MIKQSKKEKIIFYATAPLAYAGIISRFENGDFVDYWVGKLRGKFISKTNGKWKFETRERAVQEAVDFRQSCIDDAKKQGWM